MVPVTCLQFLYGLWEIRELLSEVELEQWIVEAQTFWISQKHYDNPIPLDRSSALGIVDYSPLRSDMKVNLANDQVEALQHTYLSYSSIEI
ncbi:hypothetical protein VNO78_15329 [Psophocarpus tetragonolobus]|uniref:Uncharacterized protein n=1 Tax=Psophocarpus tetragonolobus TaxID=3891 RepID=A0AAN9SEV0_PSOTE